MIRLTSLLALSALLTISGCGDDAGVTDTGGGDGSMDSSTGDTGTGDSGTGDTGTGDGGDTGSGDAGPCGPNTCPLCDPACSPLDQCVGDAWVCDCICEGPARLCMFEQDAVAAFIASNKTCVNDTDCMEVAAPCYEAQEDCCVVYMSNGFDNAAWGTLTTALSACADGGSGCACCAAIPAPPACNTGSCGPGTR